MLLDTLESLVDQSLLQASQAGDEPRFTMLETVREYAVERLMESGEAQVVQRRYAEFFLVLAEGADSGLEGAKRSTWFNRLEVEYGNLRAALAWSIDRAIDVGLRLAGALGRFWAHCAHHNEGRDWLAKALAKSAGDRAELDPFRARALNRAGLLARSQGDIPAAISLQKESLALCQALGDKRGLAHTLRELGILALKRGDRTKARLLLEESIALLRQVDNPSGLVLALVYRAGVAIEERDYERARSVAEELMSRGQEMGAITWVTSGVSTLGHIASAQGDYAAAHSFYEQALIGWRDAKDEVSVGKSLSSLGQVLYAQGSLEQAKAFWEDSLEIRQKIGHKSDVAWVLYGLGYVSLHLDRWQDAQRLFGEGLGMFREVGDARGVATGLAGTAGVAERAGRPERSAQLLGAVEAILEASGMRLPSFFQPDYDHAVAATRSQLDEATFEAAWAEGRAMAASSASAEEDGWEQVIAYARGS
jgi:tetratricopeptide (TPR) repeat protein